MTSYVNLVSLNPSRTYYKGNVTLTADSDAAAKKIVSLGKSSAQVQRVSDNKVALTISGVGVTVQFSGSVNLKGVMPGDHVTIEHNGLTAKGGGTLAGGSFNITL